MLSYLDELIFIHLLLLIYIKNIWEMKKKCILNKSIELMPLKDGINDHIFQNYFTIYSYVLPFVSTILR